MSFIVWKDDNLSLEMVDGHFKKTCELGSLRLDEQFKSHEAAIRMKLAESPLEHLLHLKYSRIEAFKNDQIAQASKLQQEVEDIKKKRNEIEKEVNKFDVKWTSKM